MPRPTLQVRPAAVAGRLYPGSAGELAAEVDALLGAVPVTIAPRPKALIVPHAAYVYSGPIAARAYRLLSSSPPPSRVVLLGPAHHVALRGIALPGVDALASPLGVVRVDAGLAARAAASPQVLASREVHAREHALEVQLPFLQQVLGADFSVLPLIVGQVPAAQLAALLSEIWDDSDTLIVVSTDLSHCREQAVAHVRDSCTARQILALDPDIDPDQACGAFALRGFLQAAREHRLSPRLLDLRSSGDTGGDLRRVVGYGAFAFTATDA